MFYQNFVSSALIIKIESTYDHNRVLFKPLWARLWGINPHQKHHHLFFTNLSFKSTNCPSPLLGSPSFWTFSSRLNYPNESYYRPYSTPFMRPAIERCPLLWKLCKALFWLKTHKLCTNGKNEWLIKITLIKVLYWYGFDDFCWKKMLDIILILLQDTL